MSNNRIILDGCIAQYKKDNQIDIDESELFEIFCLTQVTKNLNLTFEEISNSVVDGSMDGGIDSILILINNEYIGSLDDLEQVDFSNTTKTKLIISQTKKENSFKETTIDKLITSSSIIFNLELDEDYLTDRFNSGLIEKILTLRAAWLKTSINGGQISTDFIYCCVSPELLYNSAFSSKMAQLTMLVQDNTHAEVDFLCYSSNELLKLYQTRKQSRFTLNFKDQPLSTSFGNGGIGFVGTMKLGDYKNFLTDQEGNIKDYLFESNIRHFQGATIDVNKKIARTISDNISNDFWWLNNGITIIAENPNQAAKILAIDNVQIVNGLQTSFSIFNSHDGSLDDERAVLVKVIINKDNETIDSIIECTNSQNAVNSTALRATEDTQRKLELFFLNEGYFYDRRKNYYKNLGKPTSKIISIQFAAQAIETIVFNNPHTARSKPTSLIKDDKTYNKIFDPDVNFKAYLNCCLIVKKTLEYWSKYDGDLKEITANFKLHLARVATSFIIGKTACDYYDLATLEISAYSQDKFSLAIDLLKGAIAEFLETNSSITNMAKSRAFTEKLLEHLQIFQIL